MRACRLVLAPLLMTLPLIGTGCPSTHPADRAKAVLEERIAGSAEVADFAFSLFGDAEDPAGRRFLVDALGADSPGTVRRALGALGESPPPGAREALLKIFATSSGTRKLQAAVALARLQETPARDWLRQQVADERVDAGPAALEILAAAGEEQLVTDVLRRRMESENLGVRNEAYAILGRIRQLWATRLLVEGLDREFGEERAQAVRALGRSGIPEVAPRIEKLIGFQGLVLPSIEALGNLGSPGSATVIAPLLTHEQPLVRAYAAVAMWKLGRAAAGREVIEQVVAGDDALARRELAEQLASVPDSEAADVLAELVHDADPTVRSTALRSMLERPTAPPVELLLTLATDPDYQVSTVALSGLARVGRPEDVPALEPLLDSENPYVAVTAARALLAIHGRAEGATGS